MKNKIFNVWIKELCSLVFVQSMQALLLTIMLTVVVRLYVSAGDSLTAKESMGVYAIFILAIIPKVELLVKKIFGLGSGVMDDSMMGGKSSLLKTGLAIRGAASILNNAGKAVGGIAGIASSTRFGSAGKRARIAKNNMEAAQLKDNSNNQLQSLPRAQRNLGENLTQDENSGLSNGSSVYSLGDLTTAIRNANAPDPTEAYDKARHELMQQRLKGIKQLTSGVAETIGAVGGASVGAVIGLGTGGDDVLTNMGIGIGVGDKIGKSVAETTVGSVEKINDWNYDRKELNKKLKSSNDKKNQAQNEYNELINKIQNNTNNSSVKKSNNNVMNNSIVQENYKKAIKEKQAGNMEAYKQYRAKAAGAAQILKQQQKDSEKQARNAINNTKKTMGRTTGNKRIINNNSNVNGKPGNVDDIQ